MEVFRNEKYFKGFIFWIAGRAMVQRGGCDFIGYCAG
jgi:hypothetical protein